MGNLCNYYERCQTLIVHINIDMDMSHNGLRVLYGVLYNIQ